MSWDERIFGLFYGYFVKVRSAGQVPESALVLDDVRRQSEVLLSALCESTIEIRDSSGWGGFQGSILFLPAKIDFLPTSELQKSYLEWRILVACLDFETGGLRRDEDGLKFVVEHFPRLRATSEELRPLFEKQGYEALLGCTPKWDFSAESESEENQESFNREALSSGTEIKGNTKDRAEQAKIKEGQDNPLVHVLEKVMTAEDYQSGSRKMDGRDEMGEHTDALNELRLSHVVRTQQSSQSLFKSNSIIEVGSLDFRDESKTEKVFQYPEWFDRKQRYQEDWCTVYEKFVTEELPVLPFEQKTARELQSRLESCFSSYQWKTRQKEGPEIDLSLAVDRVVQSQVGGVIPENIYQKKVRHNHDFAIQILVDTSLSTDSYAAGKRIIETTQEALNIFTSAFSGIMDSISIAAFSSYTRNKVHYQILKDFEEDWKHVPGRISTLKPEGYTRIGPALRHSKKRLEQCKARKKMVLFLSDAKPTDYDHYEGHHGIRDIQRAVLELQASGTKVKVLTLTDKKHSHHNFVFGSNNCLILKDVRSLADSLFHFWYESVR